MLVEIFLSHQAIFQKRQEDKDQQKVKLVQLQEPKFKRVGGALGRQWQACQLQRDKK